MKKYTNTALVILASLFLGWLTGYDFAERNMFVAAWAGFTLYGAACAYIIVGD